MIRSSLKSMMSSKNYEWMTKSTSVVGWIVISVLLTAASVAKSEEINDLQVDSGVQAQGANVTIRVSFASGGSCGVRISYGDGSTSDHRVRDTSQPLTITKQYRTQGTYQISASGRTMVRGLNSLGGCDGAASASIQIVGEVPTSLTHTGVSSAVPSQSGSQEGPAVAQRVQTPSAPASVNLAPQQSSAGATAAAQPQTTQLENCPCNWIRWTPIPNGRWRGPTCPAPIFGQGTIGSRSPQISHIYSKEGCLGTYEAQSGREYTGIYREGRFSGKSADGWSVELDIDGEPTGRIKVIEPNGDTFEGNQLMGIRNGYGSQFNKEKNEVYQGNWAKGRRNGMGKLTRNDLVVYEGEWIENEPANVVIGNGRAFANEVKDSWKLQRGRDELTGRNWINARLDQPIGGSSSVTALLWCSEPKRLSYRLTFNQATPSWVLRDGPSGKKWVVESRMAQNQSVSPVNFEIAETYNNIITGTITVEQPHGLFGGWIYRLLFDIPTNVGNVVIKVPPLAPAIQAVSESCK